jgi:penicillin-binding protein-related factor A (putative recombinase)
MRESAFNTEVVNSLRDAKAWAYKIADMPHFAGAKFRFDKPKPCDVVACFDGRFIGIESKQLKGFEAFGLRHLRPHQVEALDAMTEAGGDTWVFLNIRAKRLNKLIAFWWPMWRLRWEAEGSTKKAELEELPGIDGHKGRFEVRGILAKARGR